MNVYNVCSDCRALRELLNADALCGEHADELRAARDEALAERDDILDRIAELEAPKP